MAYLPAVRSIVDAFNSTTTPLGAGGATFGAWTDITVWNSVSVSITGTAASTAPGTLLMQFSQDGATVSRTITISIDDVASTPPRTLGTVAQYFRIQYINGGVAQTTFSLQTMLHSDQVTLVSRLDQDLVGSEDVSNVRSIPTGQQPDGDFVNAKADGTAFSNETPLVATATYNSGWVDTDGFVSIELFISTDQLSSVGGVVVQYTDDVQGATTVRATDTYSYTQEDIDRGYFSLTFPTRLDGFRVQYTNGSVDQVSFFIQADLRTNSSPLRVDQSGALITGDFQLEVALGNIPNYTNGTKFGLLKNIDAADSQPVTIWRLGDDGRTPLRVQRKTFQTVAANAFVASNAQTDAGKTITVILNDSTNTLVSATVTLDALDGRTPVDTTVSSLDCNVAFISGADEELDGDVYVTNANNFTLGVPNDGTEVMAFIPQEAGRTQQAVYRVPADTKLVIRDVHSTVTAGTANGSATVNLRVKPAGGSWYTVRPYNITTAVAIEREEIITLEAGSLVEFNVEDVGGNDLNTLAIFNYDLIQGV